MQTCSLHLTSPLDILLCENITGLEGVQMSFSNQNMSKCVLKQSVYDTVSYQSIRFPYMLPYRWLAKHSLQCYCTDLTHQVLGGANVRSNQSTHIFTQHFTNVM